MKILSIEKLTIGSITGFVEALNSYKRYTVTPEGDILYEDNYRIADYRSYEHFCGVIGKFDPYVFFLKVAQSVDQLNHKELVRLYDHLYNKNG